jgi:hypothetical protein
MPFMHKNDHFTKTGSGQTWEKLQKRAFFSGNVPAHKKPGKDYVREDRRRPRPALNP